MRYIMVTFALCLLITSAQAGTFIDDFEDGDADGWRKLKGMGGGESLDQSAQWFVENGELVHISQGVCGLGSVFAVGDNTWKDYEFGFQFRIEKRLPECWPPLIGFGVRYDTPGGVINGVDVAVVANGNIFNQPAGEWFFGGNHPFAWLDHIRVEMGDWYTAKAVVKGDHYQMFINDELVWDTKYDLPDAGAAVVMGKNCEIHFDNVVITGDDIPDSDLGIAVDSGLSTATEPQGKLSTMWGEIKGH